MQSKFPTLPRFARFAIPAPSALLLLAVLATPAAQAATGQITGFSASANNVSPGSQVDFTLSFSVSTTLWSDGGSNLEEPAPQEGLQFWSLNWYSYESESLTELRLQAGDQGHSEFPNAQAGTGYTGSWSFSMLFPSAGSFQITAGGDWTTRYEFYTSNEIATRQCSNVDPGGSNELSCTPWVYDYPESTNVSTQQGGLTPLRLTIEVQAVPEPHPGLLTLAGLAGLALRSARRPTPRR